MLFCNEELINCFYKNASLTFLLLNHLLCCAGKLEIIVCDNHQHVTETITHIVRDINSWHIDGDNWQNSFYY